MCVCVVWWLLLFFIYPLKLHRYANIICGCSTQHTLHLAAGPGPVACSSTHTLTPLGGKGHGGVCVCQGNTTPSCMDARPGLTTEEEAIQQHMQQVKDQE